MYQSKNPLFRSLSDDEELFFRLHAQKNDPPDDFAESWNTYHPVCRQEWVKRGIWPGAKSGGQPPQQCNETAPKKAPCKGGSNP